MGNSVSLLLGLLWPFTMIVFISLPVVFIIVLAKIFYFPLNPKKSKKIKRDKKNKLSMTNKEEL